MNKKTSIPGVSRDQRLSDEGLCRLEKHLSSGQKINPAVLSQWIRRYGEPARDMIKQYNQYKSEMDEV